MIEAPRTPGASRTWLWLGPPTVFGALLRLWGLPRQILSGDELHAVRYATEHDLGTIFTRTDPEIDHCVPLTAWARLALESGSGASELGLRAPVLLLGLVLVPVLALGVRRALGTRAAGAFAWLLALAPMLVLYGRILRSYGPILLLALAAVFAFWRWLERGERRDAWLYALLAPLAAYFHLVSAIFVAAPLAFGLLSARWRKQGPRAGAVLALAAGSALVATLLFAPVAASLLEFARGKSGAGDWRWQTLWSTLQLQAGVRWPALAWLFFGVCALGAVRLARRSPGLLGYLVFVSTAHVVGLFVVSPWKLSNVLVFDRYVLLLLPILLVFAACAFGFENGRGSRAHARHGLLALFLGLLFLGGPLATWGYLRGSFAHHNRFLSFEKERFDTPPGDFESPSFYARLAEDSGAGAIIEYPADYRWSRFNAPYYHQLVHQKEVLVSSDIPLHNEPRLRWRNAVASRARDFLASRADLLVVHLDPGAEERALAEIYQEASWREPAAQARALRQTLLARWGPPAFEGEGLAVWDLRAVRADPRRR